MKTPIRLPKGVLPIFFLLQGSRDTLFPLIPAIATVLGNDDFKYRKGKQCFVASLYNVLQ